MWILYISNSIHLNLNILQTPYFKTLIVRIKTPFELEKFDLVRPFLADPIRYREIIKRCRSFLFVTKIKLSKRSESKKKVRTMFQHVIILTCSSGVLLWTIHNWYILFYLKARIAASSSRWEFQDLDVILRRLSLINSDLY